MNKATVIDIFLALHCAKQAGLGLPLSLWTALISRVTPSTPHKQDSKVSFGYSSGSARNVMHSGAA